MIKIKCLGACQEVGRSSFLVDAGDKMLLDRGVKLSVHETQYPLGVKTNLNAAIISHAHLDHSGNLPHQFLESTCLTYMTPPTLDLAKMLWFDTLKIAGLEGMDAGFTKEEIKRTEKFTFPVHYKKQMDITERSHMEFFDAGHIMGSAITKLTLGDKVFVYTGDFKSEETRLHKGADLKLGNVDYLMMESTYGNRNHPPRKENEKKFVEDVQDTLDRGGHAIVTAFALGRSQEVIDILHEYRVNAPIYFDGMGQKAARIMQEYPAYLKDPGFLNSALKKVNWVGSVGTRKKALKQPSVIVTTSGMLTGGPVYAYLPALYNDKNSKLFMTGYQVKETPGRVLLETGKINLNGIMVDMQMQFEKYDFSAHASQKEMLEACEKWNPEKVILVHGDKEVIEIFGNTLRHHGFDVIGPALGDEIVL